MMARICLTCFEEHMEPHGLFVYRALQMILLMSAGLCRARLSPFVGGESLGWHPRTSSNAPSVAHRPPTPAGLPGQQVVGGVGNDQGARGVGFDPQGGEVGGSGQFRHLVTSSMGC